MGFIQQVSCGISDTRKMSASMWFRVPSVGGMVVPSPGGFSTQPLMTWGLSQGFETAQLNLLSYDAARNPTLGNEPFPNAFFAPGNWYIQFRTMGCIFINQDSGPTAYICITNRFASLALTPAYDDWFHFAFGWDGSSIQAIVGIPIEQMALAPYPIANMVVNGASHLMNQISIPSQFHAPSIGGLPGVVGGSDGVINFDLGTRLSNGMYLNNLPVGIPLSQDRLDNAPLTSEKIEMDCTQVWFGQYIDWSNPTNYAKLAQETDGKLYPVGGAAAAEAFGTPDLWFERDNVSGILFEENQGTAGEFEVSGTAPDDFEPTPNDDPPDAP